MLVKDLRFAIRGLLKWWGFSLVAMTTVALGIGVNTAMFSVVHAVLLKPLPYPQADRMVRVRGGSVLSMRPGNLSPMDFLDLHERTRRFERLAAYNNYADATLTGAGEPERVAGTRVTADFFAALHVHPVIGRDFEANDDRPGANAVAILTHGFWLRRFGGDRTVIGRTIHLNSVATEIIGVLPAWFRHPLSENSREPDVFVPFAIDRKENNRGGHYLQAIGLLKPGVSAADGQADLASIAADLEREYPRTNADRSVMIEPLLESMVGDARRVILILLGTVAFVLLIACVNLANLLLARSTARQQELAVRQALGASRWQLVRQLLTESVVLACAGGTGGLLVARWAVRALSIIGSGRIPRGDSIAIDPVVLAFAFGLSLVTGLAFGIGPAWYATGRDAATGLHEGGRGQEGRVHPRMQRALIVSEMALALVLLVGAGLFVKSLWRLQQVDPGFRPDHVLTVRTSLPLARYPEGAEIPFYQRVETELATVPAIRAIGAINILPLSSNYSCDGFDIEGRPPAPPGQEPCAEHRSATPGYFEAMQIALLRGRVFTQFDTEDAAGVAVISDNMARAFWPGQSPIGARVQFQRKPRTIIGVVAGVKHFGLDRDTPFELYTPHAQQPSFHSMTLVFRTPADADSLMPSVRRVLWSIDRDVPIADVRTMEKVVADSTNEPRFRTLLLTAFAALALVLSVVGVAGVIAYAVSRRRQEIGVRVALGATSGRVTSMMLLEGLWPAVAGILVGIAGSFALTRILAGLLFGVTATDLMVFTTATVTLLIAAIAATFIPARRAASVDPMVALRSS